HQGDPSFFNKYRLKVRIYDVFYNLIYRYDPEVPNFNHRPFVLRHRRIPHLHPEQGPGQSGSEVRGRRLQCVHVLKLSHSRQAE
ncbi:MAG: hypothetical protein ACKPKO_00130, partial [Candidatus Fonsibacter sp.]